MYPNCKGTRFARMRCKRPLLHVHSHKKRQLNLDSNLPKTADQPTFSQVIIHTKLPTTHDKQGSISSPKPTLCMPNAAVEFDLLFPFSACL